jgi:TonB-dependent SusC/RagA subfamily outer membrane receptor
MNTGYESRRLHRFSLILLGCSLAIPVLMGCARTQALAEEEEIDDDTVMIPYSKIDKDDLTYSVTQLDQEDIERRHVRRVEELLEGRVSGVNVIERSGGRITVQIRGVSTIFGNTEPLWVVDGMPVMLGPDGMNWLNPKDVDSISVLKGPMAAIYGSRGANGVILIKTKRGR